MASIQILSLHPLNEMQQEKIRNARRDVEIILNVASAKNCEPFLEKSDVVVAFGQTNLKPLLPKLISLKWLQALTAGVDGWLALDEIKNSSIILTNARGIHGIPMAEQVLGYMLASVRKLFIAYDLQKKSSWQKISSTTELYGKTVVIVGLGAVGQDIAKACHFFGMRVLSVKHSIEKFPFVDEAYTTQDLEKILPQADFVIVTVPKTSETENLFSMKKFSLMKPTAHFINVARGEVVVEDDLHEALEKNILAGAYLDVFRTEPLPTTSPLWQTKNLFITPHNCATSEKYVPRAIALFCENLKNFPDVTKMKNVIDKQRGY